MLASRAAEELYFDREEMSTINQRKIVMARRIVQKLLISDNLEVRCPQEYQGYLTGDVCVLVFNRSFQEWAIKQLQLQNSSDAFANRS